uniref:Putative conserved secreted protein n=1 Tax=Phlebotomus kandelakii TaxID=1109342 RepID=A0A6B2EC28_9DIPT
MVYSGDKMHQIGVLWIAALCMLGSLTAARSSSGLHSEQSAPPSRVQQCREGCLEKFATEDFACLQGPECSMCWDQCASVPSKINTSIQEAWPLKIITMIRQGSLVSADVAWPTMSSPSQCLVTWEVSGGGLMGNLLTDSSSVQLSLWPETKYRVQVTCKNKKTEAMTRSLPLTLDTSQALVMVRAQSSSTGAPPSSTTRVDSTSHNSPDTTSHRSSEEEEDLDDSEEEDYNDIFSDRHGGHRAAASFGIWSLYESRKEVTLGVSAAILVFLIIVAVFLVNIRRTRRDDKESLIDNEVGVDFLPPATTQTVHV